MNTTWFSAYAYLIVGILILLVGGIAVYFAINQKEKTAKRSLISCFLIWPLLIDQHQKNDTKRSNKFVIVGLILMLLLVIAGLVIHPGVR